MFTLRDIPSSHSSALIFQEEKSRQASESDLSIWRRLAMAESTDGAPSVILCEAMTVNHSPQLSLHYYHETTNVL